MGISPETVAQAPLALGGKTGAAVYFCILEALQNVAKYAGASRATMQLRVEGTDLTFAVADDGAGFDPDLSGYGTGLQGMADRLAALGGDLRVTSAPGSGTVVEGRLPVAPPSGAEPESGVEPESGAEPEVSGNGDARTVRDSAGPPPR